MTDKFKITVALKVPEGIDPDTEVRGTIEINSTVLEEFAIKQNTTQHFEHEIDLDGGDHILTVNNN